ncbi:sporulation protein YunB [Clostridium oceanicum]|uniref:Sporulation protein YunB n=2 Tax=Clostridium oceanicum TaxID=1543 RepID=A0ABP3V3S9_9CLOT
MVEVADSQMRTKIVEIISKTVLTEYSKRFNYDKIMNIDKDKQGNITLLRADTLKMNSIACDVSLEAQRELKKLQQIGIKFPLGYMFKNNLIAYYGPNVKVRMEPIGYIETKYLSNFESAGINQTRHTIYVQVKTNVKVIIPFKTDVIEVKNQVPICETIIVGKTPETAIDMNLDSAGFKMKSAGK